MWFLDLKGLKDYHRELHIRTQKKYLSFEIKHISSIFNYIEFFDKRNDRSTLLMQDEINHI